MIAQEYSFRLVPLNAERAFVSNALIRACFEMGNPKSPVLGVDPDAGPESTVQRRLKIAAVAAIYGGKIVLTGGESLSNWSNPVPRHCCVSRPGLASL